jgi:hypothetical protein
MYMVLNGKFNRITPKFNSSMALVTLYGIKEQRKMRREEITGTLPGYLRTRESCMNDDELNSINLAFLHNGTWKTILGPGKGQGLGTVSR